MFEYFQPCIYSDTIAGVKAIQVNWFDLVNTKDVPQAIVFCKAMFSSLHNWGEENSFVVMCYKTWAVYMLTPSDTMNHMFQFSPKHHQTVSLS